MRALLVALALLAAGPALAQDPGWTYSGPDGCGSANSFYRTRMAYWFAEGTAWLAVPSQQTPYLLILNPTSAPQDVTVTVWVDDSGTHAQTVTVGARKRIPIDVGKWLREEGEGSTVSFAAEVLFSTVGEASMATWSEGWKTPVYQNPAPKCLVAIFLIPYWR